MSCNSQKTVCLCLSSYEEGVQHDNLTVDKTMPAVGPQVQQFMGLCGQLPPHPSLGTRCLPQWKYSSQQASISKPEQQEYVNNNSLWYEFIVLRGRTTIICANQKVYIMSAASIRPCNFPSKPENIFWCEGLIMVRQHAAAAPGLVASSPCAPPLVNSDLGGTDLK